VIAAIRSRQDAEHPRRAEARQPPDEKLARLLESPGISSAGLSGASYPCRDLPLDAALRRSLERTPVIFPGFRCFFASRSAGKTHREPDPSEDLSRRATFRLLT